MRKTLLLSSRGSRLRKHISTRQKSSRSRLAPAMAAQRRLCRAQKAFSCACIARRSRQLVAWAAAKKHRALQAIVSGSVTLAKGSVFYQTMSPRLLRFGLLATVRRACSISSFRRIARDLRGIHTDVERERHVPENSEERLLTAQV